MLLYKNSYHSRIFLPILILLRFWWQTIGFNNSKAYLSSIFKIKPVLLLGTILITSTLSLLMTKT